MPFVADRAGFHQKHDDFKMRGELRCRDDGSGHPSS